MSIEEYNEEEYEEEGLEEIDENSVDYVPPTILPEAVDKNSVAKKKTTKSSKKDKNTKNRDFRHMFWGLSGKKYTTGIHALDIVLGGGFERGDIIEVSGDSCLGKTTMIMDMCRRMYNEGMTIAYLDSENAMHEEFFNSIGIPKNEIGSLAGESRFFVASPTNFKDLFDICEVLLRDIENPYDIIIIDSLSNIVEYTETMDFEDKNIGLRARQETKFFTRFKADFRRTKTSVFIINQMRTKMGKVGGMFVALPDDSTGGKASKHNYDIRLRLLKGQRLTRKEETILGSKMKGKSSSDDETPYGCISRLQAEKNRNERPFIPVNLHVIFGQGINNTLFLIDVIKKLGYVVSKGSGYWSIKENCECEFLCGNSGRGDNELEMLISKYEPQIVEHLKKIGRWSLVIK